MLFTPFQLSPSAIDSAYMPFNIASLTSLSVLRNLEQSLMRNSAFQLEFIHVLQGTEAAVRRRWKGMQKIHGFL